VSADDDRDEIGPGGPPREMSRRVPVGARFLLGMILGVALVALAAAIYAFISRPPPSPGPLSQDGRGIISG
jgi:hypothetical protein